MIKLKVKEIIQKIQNEEIFEAEVEDGSFRIKINRYVPYCCTAIHDGGNLRSELKSKIAIDDYGRWYEEDPFTGNFISSMPITLIGQDSRYEYDLNRSPENAIFEEAWGRNVWKKKLTSKDKERSLKKHSNYYQVTHALIQKLEEKFDGCIVYDMHSYNWKRWDRKVPLFNIGAEKIDKKFNEAVENWNSELNKIELNNIESECKINDTFFGRGYNLEYITNNFDKTLVLATEVKKVYCDEETAVDYPNIIKELQQKLKKSIVNHANYFSQNFTNWKHTSKAKLLDNKIDPTIKKVDAKLFKLLRNFELLSAVNPINSREEERKFIKSKFTRIPEFKYKPIKINAFELKQALSNVPIQDISDISIRNLYEGVVNSYSDKIDLIASLNSKKFQYNSLRYFGRPSKKDIQNANYILHLPPIDSEPKRSPSLGTEAVEQTFSETLNHYGFEAKIEKSKRVISQVMVLNSKQTILIRPDAKFLRTEINALAEHEIGVHMVTTKNSANQKLKVFNLGLPVNTETQEGLAILSEYLSGNFTMKRLKKIALRVIVVDMMCNGADFIECFNFLHKNHIQDENDAFSMTTRIFRGGGFTKDFLYLSGFTKILKFWKDGNSLEPLLVGKTSLQYYKTIEEMIDRKLIDAPQYVTRSYVEPKQHHNDDIYEYILSGLK